MMYSLSFPEAHHFTITAEQDCVWWLERLASLLTLPPSPILHSGRITIAPPLPDDPTRSRDWQVFGDHQGKVAVNREKKKIEIGIPGEAAGDPLCFSAGIKMLMVAISMLLLPHHGLFLHAATLVRDGQAVLIVASSGGGKSTSARRVPPPWSAPGDENCLAIPDGSGGYCIHVLPTASRIAGQEEGISWDCSTAYPLKAVFILKKDEEDRIVKSSLPEAGVWITDSAKQATQTQLFLMNEEFRREVRQQSFEQACIFVQMVPVYLLSATLTGRFWELIEDEIFEPS
jgi:SynChlorMet cassette protein ScmC